MRKGRGRASGRTLALPAQGPGFHSQHCQEINNMTFLVGLWGLCFYAFSITQILVKLTILLAFVNIHMPIKPNKQPLTEEETRWIGYFLMFITVVSSWNYLLWCPFGNAGHFRHENHILGNIIKRQINTVQTTKHKERRNTYVLNFCDMTGTTGMISVIFSLIFSYSRLYLLSSLCLGCLGKMLSWFIDEKSRLWSHCLNLVWIERMWSVAWDPLQDRPLPCWCSVPPWLVPVR